ncbi:hypothetical protein FE257_007967 [Aspergillus nanangensis]|uniref:Uncharacterized protein n=1 Tax=Aspergillus nanangensis TaxID=2582783 RepID=A0AAD4GY27_ASPNN|nr:hypothetical protein FE257_007967 [Aspergillus nanangensis]
MRFSILAVMAMASTVLAQEDPGPSPTASVGCEPHGDHWHCEGPATEAATETTVVTPTMPSPTQSVGCEPHGDHWHCDGPASTEATATTTASASHSHDDDDDEEEATETPTMPSPSESVGCEPHGDHWHCEGPAETGSVSATTSAEGAEETGSSEEEGSSEEGAAGMLGVELSAVIALAVGVAVVQL